MAKVDIDIDHDMNEGVERRTDNGWSTHGGGLSGFEGEPEGDADADEPVNDGDNRLAQAVDRALAKADWCQIWVLECWNLECA